MDITTIELGAVILGCTQLIKQLALFNTKYLPLAAIAVAGTFVSIKTFTPEAFLPVMETIIYALTASGLYGGAKEVLKVNK